jgi:hypothetical protein
VPINSILTSGNPVVTLSDNSAEYLVNRGVPFMLDNKTQPIGKSIQQLTDLIKEKITKLENTEVEVKK